MFQVLHLLPYPIYTGPAEPVLRLAREQRRRGLDARLACDRLRPGDLPARAADFGVPLEDGLWLSVKAGPWRQLGDLCGLRRRFQEVDLIHCHRSHDHSLAALARPRRARARLVRTLWTERGLGPARRLQLGRADGLIAVSRRQREALLAAGLGGPKRLISVQGAVDAGCFCPGLGGDGVRAAVGVDPEAPVAGIVARLERDRDHTLLLEAWEHVHRRLPAARLLIAGRGPLEQRLRALAGDGVIFLGYRTDLVEVYRALDLKVILAPGNDGTCRAALEAMATGRPVLAADQGALGEIVQNGVTGRVVPPADRDALAEALVDLLSDRAALRASGAAARQAVLDHHTVEQQAERILSLYQEVLANP